MISSTPPGHRLREVVPRAAGTCGLQKGGSSALRGNVPSSSKQGSPDDSLSTDACLRRHDDCRATIALEAVAPPPSRLMHALPACPGSRSRRLRQFDEDQLPASRGIAAYLTTRSAAAAGKRRGPRGIELTRVALLYTPDDRGLYVGTRATAQVLTGRGESIHGEAEGRGVPFRSAKRANTTPSRLPFATRSPPRGMAMRTRAPQRAPRRGGIGDAR